MGAGSTDKSFLWLGEILGQQMKFVGAGGGVMDDDVAGYCTSPGRAGRGWAGTGMYEVMEVKQARYLRYGVKFLY